MKPTLKALIDADIIAYREIAKGERDGVTEPSALIDRAIKEVWVWRGLAGNANPILVFSCPDGGNFRKVIMPTYKAHRSEKPAFHKEVVLALKNHFENFVINGLEADDVMGILQTSAKFGATAIVSIDKDMKTIPGRLVNPNNILEACTITEDEADYNWMKQTLIGDSTDGFKGCPGIGVKRAENALEGLSGSLEAMWAKVVDLYTSKDLTVDDAVQNARMARILRREDYDYATNSIQLWHPDSPETFDLDSMEVV